MWAKNGYTTQNITETPTTLTLAMFVFPWLPSLFVESNPEWTYEEGHRS